MKWDKTLRKNRDNVPFSNDLNKPHSRQKKVVEDKATFNRVRKISNTLHSRDKKVNSGKVSIKKNRRITKKSIDSIKSRDISKYVSKIKKYMKNFV